MIELNVNEWDEFLESFPNAHLLQTSAWSMLKADFGWKAVWVVQDQALGAQVLFRQLPFGFTLAYIPKGPVGYQESPQELRQTFWRKLDNICRTRRAVFLKVEPDLWEQESERIQLPAGFNVSPFAVQPLRTLVVDVSASEETILQRMKQKTRYNIRLADRKGVTVQPWDDITGFYQMMQTTGERDAFGVHNLAYYQRVYELFHPDGCCELLLAEHQGIPLAAVMIFVNGERAWYFYGASNNEQRNLMPTYLVQWEAMRWARQRGCKEYDLWGVPDADLQRLEAEFKTRSDGLWGVYRFKRGFGGQLRRSPEPWERVFNPWLYKLYRWQVKG
jgi:peptidoglycan pentaglycine glycine transferase (the first glycine)